MAPTGEDAKLLESSRKMAEEFEFSGAEVRAAVQEYLRLMDLGLRHPSQAMTMIPTYVTAVPDGTEKGTYLAVDLGGTNFRVCSIVLNGDSDFDIEQAKTPIPRELMVAKTSSELFSFLAMQIDSFIREKHGNMFNPDGSLIDGIGRFKLGFTFSFPVDQVGINKGYLIRWTKGFDIKDTVGKDVCALLQEELDKLKVPVDVAALVNDTVGTLMARSYSAPGTLKTSLGAIFGTGTNGAYVEKLDRITKMTHEPQEGEHGYGAYDKSTGEMVINTEWGSFDNAMKVLPDTPYDQELDKGSVNPGIQMFEKRVSGMFLGEILRCAMNALRREAGLFSKASVSKDADIDTPWSIDTSLLSFVEADDSADLEKAKRDLKELAGVSNASTADAQAVKNLVHAIGRRSARLSAIPVAAIVLATGKLPVNKSELLTKVSENISATAATITGSAQKDEGSGQMSDAEYVVDIGVDGSVVELYPGFQRYLREALKEVHALGPDGESKIRIGMASDGSGVGAALIALVASQKYDN